MVPGHAHGVAGRSHWLGNFRGPSATALRGALMVPDLPTFHGALIFVEGSFGLSIPFKGGRESLFL